MDSLKFEIVYCQQLKNSINTDASQHREGERVETTLGTKESLQFLALAKLYNTSVDFVVGN